MVSAGQDRYAALAMPGLHSPTDAEIAQAALNSLAYYGGGYTVGADDVLEFVGERPEGGWHIHGWVERRLWVLADGAPQRRRLRKRRWLHVATGTTCHSRPPDQWGSVYSCFILVLLTLWPWLNGADGLHNVTAVSAALNNHVSSRTIERWLHRAAGEALELQQQVRHALIERCEPRPVEHLFPKGLSPPESLARRRWRGPLPVEQLHRALVILFAGSVQIRIPTAVLLAEARRR